MNYFRVYDKKKKKHYYDGMTPTYHEVKDAVLNKESHRLMEMDMEDFAMFPDGNLILVDACGTFDYVESDRFIVESSTGLKDKNGREIYEGDICELEQHASLNKENTRASVFFRHGCFGFETGNNVYTVWESDILEEHIEVVGSVHEDGWSEPK